MDPHVVEVRAGADAAPGVLEIGQMGARLSVGEADLEVSLRRRPPVRMG